MGDNRRQSCDSRVWGALAENEPDRQGFRDLLAAEAHRLPVTPRGVHRSLRFAAGPAGPFLYAERDRQPRAAPAAHGPPAVQGGRHGARALPGDRGPAPPRAGLRGHRDQAPGRRGARDVHRPQAVVRRRRRAHVPAALAEDREDRGAGDRRREPREALLPARQGRQEGPRPRDPRPARGCRAARRRGVEPVAEEAPAEVEEAAVEGQEPETEASRCRGAGRAEATRSPRRRPRPKRPRSSSPRRPWTKRPPSRLRPISSGARSGWRLPRASSSSCTTRTRLFLGRNHVDRQLWFYIVSTALLGASALFAGLVALPELIGHPARIATRWNRCASRVGVCALRPGCRHHGELRPSSRRGRARHTLNG